MVVIRVSAALVEAGAGIRRVGGDVGVQFGEHVQARFGAEIGKNETRVSFLATSEGKLIIEHMFAFL